MSFTFEPISFIILYYNQERERERERERKREREK